MRLSHRTVPLVLVAIGLLALTPAAWSFFSASGAGSASATVGTMSAPSNVSGSPSGSTVSLTWTGPIAPGGGPVDGYYVQRSGAAAGGTCASSAASLLAASPTSCTDTGVASGTYTYTVVAVYRSWTASAASAPVNVASAVVVDHFDITAPAGVTAGTSFDVTVTAEDTSGATVTTYAGNTSLVWSGPGSAPSSASWTYPTTVLFTNGVGTASITLVKAETTALTVTADRITGTSASVVVSPGAAAALAWTGVTVTNGTLSTPCLFSCTNTAQSNNKDFIARVGVTDSWGNVVSNLGTGHTVTVSTPAPGSSGGGGAFTAPSAGTSVTLTIASTGAAQSTTAFTFRTQNGTWNFDTFTASKALGTSYTDATATVTKQ